MTERDRQVLSIIGRESPIMPAKLGRLLNVGTGYARELARHLVGRGLVIQQRMANGQIIYTITDAGRKELDGDG